MTNNKTAYNDAQRTYDRRKIIKKLMLEKGITNRAEILRILEIEYNIHVSRQTIYKDIAKIASLSDSDIEEFELDIASIYKKNIRDLQDMINKCRDRKEKASLMKTLSQMIKDQHTVLNNIAIRGNERRNPAKDGSDAEKKVSIVFGDPEVKE